MATSRELIEMIRERLQRKGRLTPNLEAVLIAIETELEAPAIGRGKAVQG